MISNQESSGASREYRPTLEFWFRPNDLTGTEVLWEMGGGTDGFTSLGREDAVGGGLSYYIAGHPWKIQSDYFHSWVEVSLKVI